MTAKKTAKKKTGRPPFQPTPEQRKLVEQLVAMLGLPQADICRFILDAKGRPISEMTLAKYFRNELDTGEIKANAKVAQCLFHEATVNRNVTAMIFWLKTRAKMRETDRLELTGKDGGPVETKNTQTMSDAELEAIARAGSARTPSSA